MTHRSAKSRYGQASSAEGASPPYPLLRLRNLTTQFTTAEGLLTAVDGVSLDLAVGQTLALVGESGCGKSVTALSIMRLIPTSTGRIASGSILFEGLDLTSLPSRRMRDIRGKRIAMVFQEPMTSLNPVLTVAEQMSEVIRLHGGLRGRQVRTRILELLRQVGISAPEQRVKAYPHQMSGGMRQRIMIAMALACEPALLIADEPTTALDVTVQAQILDLLRRLQNETGMSILLITHDLGVAAELADDVCVMYAGRIVERAPTAQLFSDPRHPYTRGLLNSMPRLSQRGRRLAVIPGSVPNPRHPPAGCRFHPRCELAEQDIQCSTADPALRFVARRQQVACWKAEGYPRASDADLVFEHDPIIEKNSAKT